MRRRPLLLGGIAALTGAALWHGRWRFIVVHHSGGASGDLALLTRVHRARQPGDPVDMIPYHFVIGNGRGMEMGEVAPTRRWEQSVWGAHVSGRNTWRNMAGIGVCLIGNFETGPPPERQYGAAVDLVRGLMARQDIPAERVSLHGHTPGEQTKCPGRHFPKTRFFRDIAAT